MTDERLEQIKQIRTYGLQAEPTALLLAIDDLLAAAASPQAPPDVDDECPLPWKVEGDSPENPPMIWDAKGDSIVNQMDDGRPYFEPEVAAFIVRKVNAPGASPGLERIAQEIAEKLVALHLIVWQGLGPAIAEYARETLAILSRSLEGRGLTKSDKAVIHNALYLANKAISKVVLHGPGYDWNSDPLSLTLVTGGASQAIDKAFSLVAPDVGQLADVDGRGVDAIKIAALEKYRDEVQRKLFNANKRAEKAVGELDALRRERQHALDECVLRGEDLKAAEARAAQLEAALRKYGKHNPSCYVQPLSCGTKCTCGFEAALSAPVARDVSQEVADHNKYGPMRPKDGVAQESTE